MHLHEEGRHLAGDFLLTAILALGVRSHDLLDLTGLAIGDHAEGLEVSWLHSELGQ